MPAYLQSHTAMVAIAMPSGLQPGSSAPFVQIGAPRTISGSFVVGF